jgi:hypothetical protein
MNIVLPVAGRSSRYPDVRPKWLLTNPNGNLMIVDSILGIGAENIDNLYLIYLKEHEVKYNIKSGLYKNFEKYNLQDKVHFIEIENQTKNQVETIKNGLIKINEDISFLVKDCDNYFTFEIDENDNNFICYNKLDNSITNVCAKSYLTFDNNGVVNNIIEKKVISDTFCCGGYFFKSSKQFIEYSDIDCDDLYISDVVYKMMLNGINFLGKECFDYSDWGTLKDWEKYKEDYKTLFLDIDGVLMYNCSEYIPPYIESSEFIEDNLNYLKKLSDSGKVEIVLTTSRPESCREITETKIKSVGLKYKHLIMDLQHNKRIIINDFGNTNKYRSCDAVNIPRNSNILKSYLT